MSGRVNPSDPIHFMSGQFREVEFMIRDPSLAARAFGGSVPDRPPRKRHYEILRPKAQGEVTALITSQKLLITWTHFFEKHSYMCLTNRQDPNEPTPCDFCKNKVLPRMKGYLCGVNLSNGKACLVELTDNAIRENPILLRGMESVRGKEITLRRPGKNHNSPVFASLAECYRASMLKTLPAPFDLMEALGEMWDQPFQQEFEFNLMDPRNQGRLSAAPADLPGQDPNRMKEGW